MGLSSWATGVVLVLLMLGASAALWWQHVQSSARLRSETLMQVELRATQLGSAAATAAGILFRAVDATAQELAVSYIRDKRAVFAEQVRLAIEYLPRGALLQAAVIDASGHLAYSNLGISEKVFLGDREHFKVHLNTAQRQLFISKPVLGRVSKQWSIQFSRPIYDGERFAGVLVMSVSPDYLQEALVNVALQSGDSITLIRNSGEFLARDRDMAAALGKASVGSRPFMSLEATPTGLFIGQSQIDGVERIFYWQRLGAYPVTVLMGLSKDTAFHPIERVIAENRVKASVGIAALWAVVLVALLVSRRANIQAVHKAELELVALLDPLTGLSNRRALMAHLERVLARAGDTGARVGLLYLDLDSFKPVNDRHGHAGGDQVLRAVAQAIKACLRSTDMAARIGGDEFVVVLAPLEGPEALTQLSERMHQALQQPIRVAATDLSVRASIGTAVFPDHGATPDDLIRHADQAMYRAKAHKP